MHIGSIGHTWLSESHGPTTRAMDVDTWGSATLVSFTDTTPGRLRATDLACPGLAGWPGAGRRQAALSRWFTYVSVHRLGRHVQSRIRKTPYLLCNDGLTPAISLTG